MIRKLYFFYKLTSKLSVSIEQNVPIDPTKHSGSAYPRSMILRFGFFRQSWRSGGCIPSAQHVARLLIPQIFDRLIFQDRDWWWSGNFIFLQANKQIECLYWTNRSYRHHKTLWKRLSEIHDFEIWDFPDNLDDPVDVFPRPSRW